MAASWQSAPLTHNGEPIPPWTVTAQEYEIVHRFPEFMQRFETGPDCLTLKERFELQEIVDQCTPSMALPFHDKVSLLSGGNLAYIAADCVVNPSNNWLTTGKGVNGALHSEAGECLLDECIKLGGCNVGEAKLTSGYNLPAKHVLHTVGPEGKDEDRIEKLRSCYKTCLDICLTMDIKSIAFPCISTGQYCYPSVEAANIALTTVGDWLKENHAKIERIIFVTRRPRDEESYSRLMLKYFPMNS